MRRFPDPRVTLRQLRHHGLRWGVRRTREELRTPTYGASGRAALQIERARQVMRRTRATDLRSGADIVAVYELTPGSIGFDFAFFLVFAEAFARANGGRTVFVLFVRPTSDPHPAASEIQDADNAAWRFENIVLPIVGLHAATVGYTVLPAEAEVQSYLDGATVYPPLFSSTYRPVFNYRQSLPALQAGEFDGFRAPVQARRYVDAWSEKTGIDKPMVVITLRQRRYDAVRNSNVPEWAKFAGWLTDQGYAPVFVPDTDAAWDPAPELEPFPVFREAPWNLALRMALYEAAYLCFFFSNGPAALAMLSPSVRYVAYNPPNEESRHATAAALSTIAWDVGRRAFDFAGPGQLLSSETDDFENLRREFSAYANGTD